MGISTFSPRAAKQRTADSADRLSTPFLVTMPSLVTGASLFAGIMAFTACLRFARALPLNGVSGGQQRYAFVGQGARVGIPCRHLKDRRTGVQSLSCTAARSTDSRSAGAVSPAERIYQLAGREFEIGKPSVLAKVSATTYSCTR